MKKLLALLLISPLAFAEKNEMIPLQDWMVVNKDNIGASEALYISYRCIGLYTMMYGLLLNAPQEGAVEIIKDIGMKGFSAHSLRHTHASNLLMNNCPVVQVANRLGHKDATVTLKVYASFIEQLGVDFNEYMPKIHA